MTAFALTIEKMTTFALTAGVHYLKGLNFYRTKSGETKENVEILQQHMPPLIQRMLPERQQLNILSTGSAEGEKDMIVLKIIKDELQKSDHGQQMKIFNRAIEPNEYSCGLCKAAIENLLSPLEDQQIEFEICQQSFQEYQKSEKDAVKFDIVHFLHSIYHVDVEQTLRYAWFNSTCYYPPPVHTSGDLQFCSRLAVYSPPPGLLIDHKYVVLCTKHRLRY